MNTYSFEKLNSHIRPGHVYRREVLLAFSKAVDRDLACLVKKGQLHCFWFCLNGDVKRLPNPCYTHYAFSVLEKDFNNITKKIQQAGAPIFKENTSPGKSLYFLDPDGHKLEIHIGSYIDRLTLKKMDLGSWKNVEWFV